MRRFSGALPATINRHALDFESNLLLLLNPVAQKRAGLGSLTKEEHAQFTELNAAYKAKFGIVFILAVRNASKQTILEAFKCRLRNTPSIEVRWCVVAVRLCLCLRSCVCWCWLSCRCCCHCGCYCRRRRRRRHCRHCRRRRHRRRRRLRLVVVVVVGGVVGTVAVLLLLMGTDCPCALRRRCSKRSCTRAHPPS